MTVPDWQLECLESRHTIDPLPGQHGLFFTIRQAVLKYLHLLHAAPTFAPLCVVSVASTSIQKLSSLFDAPRFGLVANTNNTNIRLPNQVSRDLVFVVWSWRRKNQNTPRCHQKPHVVTKLPSKYTVFKLHENKCRHSEKISRVSCDVRRKNVFNRQFYPS